MKTMKQIRWITAAAAMAGTAPAQDIRTKADNTTALNIGSSWVEGTTPISTRVALFNSTLSAGNSTVELGATDNFTALTIRVEDVQGGLLSLVCANAADQIRPYSGGLIVTNSTDLSIVKGTLANYGGTATTSTWRIAQGRLVAVGNTISPNYHTRILNEGTMIGSNGINIAIGARSNTQIISGNGSMITGDPGLSEKAFSVGSSAWTEANMQSGFLHTFLVTNQTLLTYGDMRFSSGAWNVSDSSFHNAKVYTTRYLDVGYGDSTRAIMTLTGGSVATSMYARIGRAGSGTLNIENGSLTTDDLRLGILGGVGQVSTGRVNQTGGTVTTQTLEMQASGGADVRGYYTLSGGTLSVGEITRTGNQLAGNDTALTLDGGTIKPVMNNATWMGGGGANLYTFTTLLTANGAVVDTDGFNVTINNILENAPSETGTLTKLGAGTLTLAGDNLYTGATTVEAGKLVVNGSMGGGMITVKNGAELGGASTGAGPVTLEAGSTLSPGNSIGALEVGNLTLEGTTTWAMELDNDGSTSDQVSLSGALIAGFTFEKVILDFLGGGVNGSYLLIPTFSSVDSLSASNFEVTNLASGLSGTINLDTTANEMTLTVIPEPGTLGALGLFAVAALLRRRLRR